MLLRANTALRQARDAERDELRAFDNSPVRFAL